MSTIVYIDNIEDLRPTLNKRCACGHLLYEHGFTWGGMGNNQYFTVSQCVFCGYDEEKKKYNCEGFHST